jgi:hypothetical protein
LLVLCAFAGVSRLSAASPTDADLRAISVEIRDNRNRPVANVRIKYQGSGWVSELSSDAGNTRLVLPQDVVPGGRLEIELEPGTPLARDWTFLQPLDGVLIVPGPTVRFYRIILIERASLELAFGRAPRTVSSEQKANVDLFDGSLSRRLPRKRGSEVKRSSTPSRP